MLAKGEHGGSGESRRLRRTSRPLRATKNTSPDPRQNPRGTLRTCGPALRLFFWALASAFASG